MSDTAGTQTDYRALLRSPEYRKLLVLCGGIGLVASLVAWAFLSLVPWIQDTVFLDLPDALGFDSTPAWWPLPVLAFAGLVTAIAIAYMPGAGGGIPAEGLATGVTQPSALPGVLLAALATLGLGLVLGPSSPVIALGMGVGLLVVRRVSEDLPEEALNLVAAAGAFAAFAMVFNNPWSGAVTSCSSHWPASSSRRSPSRSRRSRASRSSRSCSRGHGHSTPLSSRARRGRSPPSPGSCCSSRSRGACRWAASAAGPCSRRSSSGPSGACWPRTSPATRRVRQSRPRLATVVAVLRLPLAAAVIALMLTASAGLKSSPLVIVAIAVSYLLGETLFALRERRAARDAKAAAADRAPA